MLRAIVYKEITEQAKKLTQDGTFLEIGAYTGAATIALRWGFKGELVVVERGREEDTLGRLTVNLAKYDTIVRLNLSRENVQVDNLVGFMHDADGRLDLDFELFWNKVAPGGLIIIDDYPDDAGTAHPKKYLTWFLLNQLKEWGLFEQKKKVFDTVFGVKPVNADWSRYDPEKMKSLVQQHYKGYAR
jgi:predicted O-methyltransferase YrrM